MRGSTWGARFDNILYYILDTTITARGKDWLKILLIVTSNDERT